MRDYQAISGDYERLGCAQVSVNQPGKPAGYLDLIFERIAKVTQVLNAVIDRVEVVSSRLYGSRAEPPSTDKCSPAASGSMPRIGDAISHLEGRIECLASLVAELEKL